MIQGKFEIIQDAESDTVDLVMDGVAVVGITSNGYLLKYDLPGYTLGLNHMGLMLGKKQKIRTYREKWDDTRQAD